MQFSVCLLHGLNWAKLKAREIFDPTPKRRITTTRVVPYNYRSYPVVVSSRRPWSGLKGEKERMPESAFGVYACDSSAGRFSNKLYVDKNNYSRAELPGFDRADIGVELVDGYLNIRATRKNLPARAKGVLCAQPFSERAS